MTQSPTHRNALIATAILSLMATFCLWRTDNDRTLNPDIAQATSAARNLLSGNGFSTDLIYYEQHYQQHAWPAKQTVFPFGYPAMIAALGSLGVPFRTAAQVLALSGFFCVPLLIFFAARRMERTPMTAMLLGLLWQCAPMNWYNVHEKQTESLFVVFTLGSMILLFANDHRHRTSRILLAGLCAGIACSLRYAGVFWLLTVGIVMAPGVIRHWKQTVREAALFFAVPGAVVCGMFFRNRIIAGEVSGGIKAISIKPWRLTFENVYYAFSRLTGLDQDDLRSLYPAEVLVAIGLIIGCMLALISLVRQRKTFSRLLTGYSTGHAACFAYLIVTMAFLTWLEKTTTVNLSPRMILPLLSFILLATADVIAFACTGLKESRSWRYTVGSAATGLLVGTLISQGDVYQEIIHQPERLGMVRDVLSAPVTRSDFLDAQVAEHWISEESCSALQLIRGKRILTNEHHMLPEVTGEGALGLTEAVYTTRKWSNAEVESLARQQGVGFVVLFTSITPRDSNEFFDGLLADHGNEALPHWLTPVFAMADLRMYRIEATGPHLSMVAVHVSEGSDRHRESSVPEFK